MTAYGALSTMNWSDPNAWLNLGIKLKDLVADPANPNLVGVRPQ